MESGTGRRVASRRAHQRRRLAVGCAALAVAAIVVGAVTVRLRGSNSEEAAATTTTTTIAPMRWQNPVVAGDFPDPSIVRDGARFVALATNGPAGRIQVATSDDLVRWSAPTEALASMPVWASERTDLVWAPTTAQLGGQWVMYATFQDADSGRQCIGVATAPSATGPYTPDGVTPLLCPVADGGAIDPEVVIDGDELWLLWKVDGNCCGKRSVIRSQPLAPDGRSLLGQPSDLIGLDQQWERGPDPKQSTVEGPSMTRIEGRLVLLYSAGGYAGAGYGTGYALCDSMAGPCSKPSSTPVMASGAAVSGPGGASFVADDEGRHWVVYHAWNPAAVGYKAGGVRSARIDAVTLVGDRLVVFGPTVDSMSLVPTDRIPVTVTSTPGTSAPGTSTP